MEKVLRWCSGSLILRGELSDKMGVDWNIPRTRVTVRLDHPDTQREVSVEESRRVLETEETVEPVITRVGKQNIKSWLVGEESLSVFNKVSKILRKKLKTAHLFFFIKLRHSKKDRFSLRLLSPKLHNSW